MNATKSEQAWHDAKQANQHCHAIIEMGLLSEPARLRLLQSIHPKKSLMQQAEFANLRDYGPWLLDLTSLEFADMLALENWSDSPALMGWIRSQHSIEKMAEHLTDALLAEDKTSQVYLLRSYAPEVLPLLHARADSPWHNWLFGPINEWWLRAPEKDWQCLPGGEQTDLPPYHPIKIDDDLWQALELDPLAYSLTAELEKSAEEVFDSTCHGERLLQVRQALDSARGAGLKQADDLCLFASLYLFDQQFPENWPNWQQVADLVKEQQLPLAQALRMQAE
ncbi:DUF4123 domain-containing protein [Pseudomonas sp.]|uniref:DUF4123 domain-containing protein n=1 Tax=Pseudomonas sp. TaxID=306 RepID=UPI003D0C63D3